LIVVKACSLLAAASPESINRALAFLDSGFDNELFVLFECIGNGQQVIVDLGFKLSGNAPDFG
jgi:hypothetical protein